MNLLIKLLQLVICLFYFVLVVLFLIDIWEVLNDSSKYLWNCCPWYYCSVTTYIISGVMSILWFTFGIAIYWKFKSKYKNLIFLHLFVYVLYVLFIIERNC